MHGRSTVLVPLHSMWKTRIVSGFLAAVFTTASAAAQPPSGASPGPPGAGALVLVAPFANLAGDPADDWIGVGIAEAVAIDLLATGTPVVRTAAEVRGDTGPDGVLEAGRRAGAGRVVSGAYQRSGDLIRVTARLLDVAEGTVLRSATVTGMAADIFELQDRVAAELRGGAGLAAAASGGAGRAAPGSGHGAARPTGASGRPSPGGSTRTTGAVRPPGIAACGGFSTARGRYGEASAAVGAAAGASAGSRGASRNRGCRRDRARRRRPTRRRHGGLLRRRRPHRRTACAGAPGGDDARPGGAHDGPCDPPRRRHPPRRRARRAGVRDGGGDHRLHPAGARHRGAGDRADRGVGHVRRHERLRLGAGLGLGAREPVGGQRDAPRHQPAPPERHVHGVLRYLLRPPQRLQLLYEPARRPRRPAVHERGQPQRRLEPGPGTCGPAVSPAAGRSRWRSRSRRCATGRSPPTSGACSFAGRSGARTSGST